MDGCAVEYSLTMSGRSMPDAENGLAGAQVAVVGVDWWEMMLDDVNRRRCRRVKCAAEQMERPTVWTYTLD